MAGAADGGVVVKDPMLRDPLGGLFFAGAAAGGVLVKALRL